ncbi:hypothetical protein, partial [Listeria fleischmannii]
TKKEPFQWEGSQLVGKTQSLRKTKTILTKIRLLTNGEILAGPSTGAERTRVREHRNGGFNDEDCRLSAV